MPSDFPAATDFLAALKGVFLASPGAVAAFPGGFHTDEAASPQKAPYLIVEQASGPVGLLSSSGQFDDVRLRCLAFGLKLADAVAALSAWKAAMGAAGGLSWAGGFATIPHQTDRSVSKVKERTLNGQRLEVASCCYLYRVRQS